MYKILRIICCVIAVLFAAVAIFIFVYFGWQWGIAAVLVAAVFGALMVLFKQLQEKKERKENPPPPKGDFITGKVDPPKKDKE
ncbi:MAG: hypothetical protein K2N52_04715 [Clostridia bacterium]|nr:hypothetical protein [Clostridia bacterium]